MTLRADAYQALEFLNKNAGYNETTYAYAQSVDRYIQYLEANAKQISKEQAGKAFQYFRECIVNIYGPNPTAEAQLKLLETYTEQLENKQ